jgi:multiple sugar transport system substrate-binding protein
MKKKIIVLAALFCILASGLYAGGARNQGGRGEGAAKIRVWTDNAHEKTIRDAQVAAFNAGRGKELGIEIEYTVYGANFNDALRIALQAGEGPDLYRADPGYTVDWVTGGYALPLTELPGGQALVDQYRGELVPNSQLFDGIPYTLPYSITSHKLVVNKDLFDEAGLALPKTWDDVRNAAKVITARGGGRNYGYIMGLQSTWTINMYLVRQNMVNVGHVGFDHQTLTYKYAEHQRAVETVLGMVNDGSVFPGYENLDADQMRAQFATGRVGMIFGASFDVAVYNDQFPAQFNWVVVDPPTYESGPAKYKEPVDTVNLLLVNKTAKNLEKVAEVFKFFYSDENMAEMYENGLYVPYRSQAIALAKKAPTLKGFAEFANVPQKITLLPTPNGILAIEGLDQAQTFIRFFSRGYRENAATVLGDLDRRYMSALNQQLSAEERERYRQSPDRVIRAQ